MVNNNVQKVDAKSYRRRKRPFYKFEMDESDRVSFWGGLYLDNH